MKPNEKWKVIVVLIIIIPSIYLAFEFLRPHNIEIDKIAYVTVVIDGDTFDVSTGERVRLADINTPEIGKDGYFEAKNQLRILIENKQVYLDIDDKYRIDNHSRLVCLVYVEYNSTHLINVNQALLDLQVAIIWDHDNEFNPSDWKLFYPRK